MVLSEAFEIADVPAAFQIFATDLDQEAIEQARQGLYPRRVS
jgi:chemotaxis methyl-accepting protein methylase